MLFIHLIRKYLSKIAGRNRKGFMEGSQNISYGDDEKWRETVTRTVDKYCRVRFVYEKSKSVSAGYLNEPNNLILSSFTAQKVCSISGPGPLPRKDLSKFGSDWQAPNVQVPKHHNLIYMTAACQQLTLNICFSSNIPEAVTARICLSSSLVLWLSCEALRS